ncbi:hypothetical protein ABEB36_015628 [Hypothenemus hampei]|uniref:MADF domain-containing protein n=1 Tax=Hypothenemus hampei TaxID=57062 RepID=A0ABD1E3U3_HYPHA
MDNNILISEVFIRPHLWDQKNKNHHNRFVLDKLWDGVATKLNTTSMVRNKWKALKDKFRTTLASIPKSKLGDGATNYKVEWKYFQSLLFLKDQFHPRNHRKKMQRETAEEDEDIGFFKTLVQHLKTLSIFDKLSYRMEIIKITQKYINN